MQRNPLVIHAQSLLRAHTFCRCSLQKLLMISLEIQNGWLSLKQLITDNETGNMKKLMNHAIKQSPTSDYDDCSFTSFAFLPRVVYCVVFAIYFCLFVCSFSFFLCQMFRLWCFNISPCANQIKSNQMIFDRTKLSKLSLFSVLLFSTFLFSEQIPPLLPAHFTEHPAVQKSAGVLDRGGGAQCAPAHACSSWLSKRVHANFSVLPLQWALINKDCGLFELTDRVRWWSLRELKKLRNRNLV